MQQALVYGFAVMWMVTGSEETVTKEPRSRESEMAELPQGGSDAG